MYKYFTKLFLFSFLALSIFGLNAVDAELNKKAQERVAFWEAVVAGLNKTGYKADSEFIKRANTNLTRAQHHAQLVKSGAITSAFGRHRGRPAKATASTTGTASNARLAAAKKAREAKAEKAKERKAQEAKKTRKKYTKSEAEKIKEKARKEEKVAAAKKKLADAKIAAKK